MTQLDAGIGEGDVVRVFKTEAHCWLGQC